MAGFAVGWLYLRFGGEVEAGNNLILDEIHDPKATLPLRMAPMVLVGTWMTHLFGGSAGREGTAVQMAATLADQLTGLFRFGVGERGVLLMAGMSAGFSSVFGTPLAGALFGLEVLAIGRLRYDAILPCFVAAVIAHLVTLGWGIVHVQYSVAAVPALTVGGAASSILAGVVFGLAGMFFATLTHGLSRQWKKWVRYAPMRPLIGGVVVACAVGALGTSKYIGLGIPTIQESFRVALPPWDFLVKAFFTIVTLGSGFKGGEVTPLFFIGATLGNALAFILPLPLPLLSGMGFVAVFAGAANTPLTCTLMATELFGGEVGVYAGLACVASYLFSGQVGIYHSQKRECHKHGEVP